MRNSGARNICLWVAYDGTDFHGWQHQDGQRTVQAELQSAAQSVVRHPVTLIGSGRTDAGVHALGHVDSFLTTSTIDCERLRRAMQSRLPPDVTVLDALEVSPAFHPGFAAISKLYRYRILPADRKPSGRDNQRFVTVIWHPVDVGRMAGAARQFVGTHDFSAMTPLSTVRQTMVRTVFRCEIEQHRDEIRVSVEGDGFLYKQVRTMVGTLLEVARGRWDADDVSQILSSRDRTKAGATAPPQGLGLMWVRYPAEVLRPAGLGGASEPASVELQSGTPGAAGAANPPENNPVDE
ncbi:MAG: tRNA pseudouridine(38-40) synthase TruA [Phycisphaerae bacterium]|nr:tRNA pseudouridine(38-40) synthase TruA [Phycisphaerae bacterium]